MNPPTENESPPPAPSSASDPGHRSARPENWREAMMALVSSRIELIQLEAREAARMRARRVVAVIVAVICMFFTWALLLAAGIAAISSATGWPWHWVAFGAAAIHLLAALLLTGGSAKPAEPAFPLTRAEFQKDREWIENLQKKPKSNA